jgi:holo-[acyl-carrier protein] synthase
MIRGLGIDLVAVSRIEEAARRHGERFLKRIMTEGEVAYCARHPEPAKHWAARFAAKEAGMKAIGTGWSHGVRWRDIEVARKPGGRPTLLFHGKAAEFASLLGATNIALSITHTAEQAMAQVILES